MLLLWFVFLFCVHGQEDALDLGICVPNTVELCDVTNGEGERTCLPDGYWGRCMISHCHSGAQVNEHRTACRPCPLGYYKIKTGSLDDKCQLCTNKPMYAVYIRDGEQSASCLYECRPGTYGPSCRSMGNFAVYGAFVLVMIGVVLYAVFLTAKRTRFLRLSHGKGNH